MYTTLQLILNCTPVHKHSALKMQMCCALKKQCSAGIIIHGTLVIMQQQKRYLHFLRAMYIHIGVC